MSDTGQGHETSAEPLDVVAIGSALVDVLTNASPEDLRRFDMVKGSMTLVDLAQAAAVYDAMGPAIEVSGGSAANTAAGVAALGGRVGYLGKVAADELGEVFLHDITAADFGRNSVASRLQVEMGICDPRRDDEYAGPLKLWNNGFGELVVVQRTVPARQKRT